MEHYPLHFIRIALSSAAIAVPAIVSAAWNVPFGGVREMAYIESYVSNVTVNGSSVVSDKVAAITVPANSYKTIDVNSTAISALPTITLTSSNDVVFFSNVSTATLTFDFGTDVVTDGVYTWEVMVSSDNDIASCTFGTGVEYVGSDKETNPNHSYTRIDTVRTTHVFAVRLIRINSENTWNVAYNYSFKK